METDGGQRTTNGLIDRSNILTAALLTRFRELVKLCVTPIADDATLETQAALSLQIEVEWQGLVKAAEDLLRLTRELKELWLAGPLRDIGEGEGDEDMVENAEKVGILIQTFTEKARKMRGHDTKETEGKTFHQCGRHRSSYLNPDDMSYVIR